MPRPPYRPLDAQVIPRFAGIRTFMRAPHVTDLAGVDAVVYGIPFDTATSYRTGPRFGPEAIRSASALIRPYNPALDVNVVESLSIVDYGDVPVSPGDTERTYGQIEEALAPIVDAGVFPAAMGGDHSITLAELRALARRHGPLALVQLDSHGDTWEQYFGQPYFHGTTFKRAVEEGLLDAEASVQAGMRGSLYGAEDLDASRDLGFTVLTTDELRDLGPTAYGELVRATVGARAGLRLVRHRLPRPGVRARHRHAGGRRLLDRGGARVPARAARHQARRLRRRRGRRRPTTARASRPRSRRRTSSTTCSRCARSAGAPA